MNFFISNLISNQTETASANPISNRFQYLKISKQNSCRQKKKVPKKRLVPSLSHSNYKPTSILKNKNQIIFFISNLKESSFKLDNLTISI